MAIAILSAKEYSRRLKATIHASGKLGFTEETAQTLELSPDKYIKIAYDDERDQLYMAVSTINNEDAFKVCAAGKYYYLPTSSLFEQLGYDFKSLNIIFDLKREESLDDFLKGPAYKMCKRSFDRKKEEKDMT